ncbi:MAG: hypothetical protein NTV86_07520 [Planctomycetota bacterium]|nr:hypothetical protein [Planctomycetota bacterium]
MTKPTEARPPDWDLGDWEKALTIRVGTAHVCRHCGNLVMVTRGGVGVMELRCCGHVMEQEHLPSRGGKGGQ